MSSNGNNLRRFGEFRIDLEKKILWIDSAPAELPVKAVELLCVLIENEGKVVSKKELLEQVWSDSFVEEGVLPQNVYLLRKVFKENGADGLIQTVARRGYRFTGNFDETFEEEIIIERESVERRFIAETEFETSASDIRTIPISPNRTFSIFGFNLRPIRLLLTSGFIGLIAFFSVPWIFKSSFQTDSFNQTDNKNLKYERLSVSGRVFQLGLSPNDQHAAYSVFTNEGKYSLILHHLPTGSETVIIEPQESAITSIQFAPDGNHLYYLAKHPTKKLSVHRIPLYGGPPQIITQEPIDHFSVSPDGEWLAYFRREAKVGHFVEICRSRDGSERRVVAERTGLDFFSIWGVAPDWSADGRKLSASAFSRTTTGGEPRNFLVEIDVASGTQTEIKSPAWHRIHQTHWQNDGQGLFALVREHPDAAAQIWQIEYPSGRARNITNDTNDYRQFEVSRDAAFLTAIPWVRTENLFLIPLDEPSQIRQLTFDTASVNGSIGLKWTADGREILFSKGKNTNAGNLFKLNPETLELRQLTNDENALVNYIDTTPDGRSAVFGSNRAGFWNIWQIDLDGSNLRRMTFGKSEQAPEISPDGKWLYYIGDGLWKMPLTGSESVRVWTQNPGTTRVSPTDPKQLISYFHDKNEKNKNPWMFVLYAEDAPDRFVNLNISSIIHFEWKPDGSGIYFADPGEGFNNIWFVSLKDLKPRRITDFSDQRIANLSLSPDGKTLAVARGSQTANIVKIQGF